MSDYFEDLISGNPVVLPNYEPWTTVTVTSSWTTNVSSLVAKRMIFYDMAWYDITMVLGGAPNAGDLIFYLPTGDVINTANMSSSTNISTVLDGAATINDVGVRSYIADVLYQGTGQVQIGHGVGAGNIGITNNNNPIAFGSGDVISLKFKVPLTRLAGGFTAYGSGRALSTRDGLVAPRKGETALTVTGTGWTTSRAVGIYYQDQDGNHRLKGNISGAATSASRTLYTISISGVVFKNITNFFQTVSAMAGGASNIPSSGICLINTGNIQFDHSTFTTNYYAASFDVELESKPTWA